MQLGQHAPALHVIAHVSDTHLGKDDTEVYGSLRPGAHLAAVMRRLADIKPDAIVFTGDITDLGEEGAYETVASIVIQAAADMGAELIWVMGNHDVREPFGRTLLGREVNPEAPLDQVVDIGGLRIVALDTTTPGYHDGEITSGQLAWLREQLAVPAEHGTILAMHHPPIPSHMPLQSLFELSHQADLAAVVEGTDVRTILAGHLHYSTHSTLGSVPVSVASSTCYVADPGADPRGLHGIDGWWTFDIVHVHADRVVHSTVPVYPAPVVLDYPADFLDLVASLGADERRERFARIDARVDDVALVERATTLDT